MSVSGQGKSVGQVAMAPNWMLILGIGAPSRVDMRSVLEVGAACRGAGWVGGACEVPVDGVAWCSRDTEAIVGHAMNRDGSG